MASAGSIDITAAIGPIILMADMPKTWLKMGDDDNDIFRAFYDADISIPNITPNYF